MNLSGVWSFLLLSILISGVSCEWEILNEGTDATTDEFSFKEEQFLPVNVVNKQNSSPKQQSVSSVDKIEGAASHEPSMSQQKPSVASTTHRKEDHNPGVQVKSSDKGREPEKFEIPKNDDVVDLASEGLLTVDSSNKQRTASGRKLTEYVDKLSQDTPSKDFQSSHETRQTSSLGEEIKDNSLPEQSQQNKALGNLERVLSEVGQSDIDSFNFKMACIDENSWECLMFMEDFLAMKGDVNLSRRASVLERVKRQTSSHYNKIEIVRNTGNSRNLLGCEDGCGSGDGDGNTDPNVIEVAPWFEFTGTTIVKTNLNKKALKNSTIASELARSLQDKLTTIFAGLPGFHNVTMDYKNAVINGDGDLQFNEWKVYIDGGCKSFTNKTGVQVGQMIRDALSNVNGTGKTASSLYQNMNFTGKSPVKVFIAENAVNEVISDATDPCTNIYPNPCPLGYGQCERTYASHCVGYRLKCVDNCAKIDCNKGICTKDYAGNPYCKCPKGASGKSCKLQTTPDTPKDIEKNLTITVVITSTFSTDLTPADLTPAKLKQIAQQAQEQLRGLGLGNNITINPSLITIKNGQLIIPWSTTFSDAGFTGKSPQQILDDLNTEIQDANDIYRQNITIDGKNPSADLNFTDILDQIDRALNDPCSTKPCQAGYGNCQAVSPLEVKCMENCNIKECPADTKCVLDEAKNAVCRPNPTSPKLDGGKIAGVVLGSALIVAGILGFCFWFILIKDPKKIDFSHYEDQEGSSSDKSNKDCVIPRATAEIYRQELYGPEDDPYSSGHDMHSHSRQHPNQH